ncbi:30S ribosomal protein S4 [bacterium]|nr:30S ribosomal protein S4 [bacterium]
MARNIVPQCKQCRRTGEKLFLKGNRCASDKCALDRRPYAPGHLGKSRRGKLSNYGVQLREKQKVKKIYGVMENQFRIYFKLAERKKGVTGTMLLRLLELRLDNVIFRLGFGLSRNHSRQLARHAFFSVNGKKVSIPSYRLREGDVIELRESEGRIKKIKESLELTQNRSVPEWLQVDLNKFTGKVLRVPEREDIEKTINEQLIVELYSK